MTLPIKVSQCRHCKGMFAQHKNHGHAWLCGSCRTPATLAAHGYGYEDIAVIADIPREKAREFVFPNMPTSRADVQRSAQRSAFLVHEAEAP